MRYGPNKSMDSRHQISLALNTILSTISMFLVLIPTFILRNMFLKILNSIPAFDNNLKAILSGSFIQLYTCSILGALILLQSMVLVSEDLRKPWWFGKRPFFKSRIISQFKAENPHTHARALPLYFTVYNTLRRNPFQTNTRGIDFTAHKQLKRQAEAQARAEAQAQALAQTVRQQYGVARSGYDGQGDRISEYAPTGIGPSEIAPPGGSVFISTRRPTRLGGTGTATSGPPYDYTFPPRPTERPYGATSIASSAYPHMYRRDSGVVIPSMAVHTRPGSPEFPAKGW